MQQLHLALLRWVLLAVSSSASHFVLSSLLLASCSLPLAASLGTASAEDQDGKHETKRAPAAITSLSAASRCASRPPSDPSG